jgi:hypothetical protein
MNLSLPLLVLIRALNPLRQHPMHGSMPSCKSSRSSLHVACTACCCVADTGVVMAGKGCCDVVVHLQLLLNLLQCMLHSLVLHLQARRNGTCSTYIRLLAAQTGLKVQPGIGHTDNSRTLADADTEI